MRLRNVALIFGLLDTGLWAFLAKIYFLSQSDAATHRFDVVAGVAVTFLFCITAVPALILLLLRGPPKAALIFALAFSVAFALAFIAGAITFAAI